jgi:prepilin-type N-terminal cleavage/methylation domain-containing protein
MKHSTFNLQRRTPNGARGSRWMSDVACWELKVRRLFATTPRARTSNRAAFTLIEILLAVAIFAIVLVAMNTVFYSGLRLERATTRALDERVLLNQALTMLQRDLVAAVPPNSNGVFLCDFRTGVGLSRSSGSSSGNSSGGIGGIGSFGSSSMGSSKGSALEFVTTTGTLREELPWGDLQRVRYELVDPNDRNQRGLDLIRVVTRNLLPTTSERLIRSGCWVAWRTWSSRRTTVCPGATAGIRVPVIPVFRWRCGCACCWRIPIRRAAATP